MSKEDHTRQYLQRLQGWRTRPDKDYSLGSVVDDLKKQLKPAKQLRQIAGAWEQLVPAEVLPHTRLVKFTRAVLSVHVDDAATSYRLSQLLREGLLDALQRQSPTTLRDVKIRIEKDKPETRS